MSVTYYLTDHQGRKVAFFYRIENERYSKAPSILWACRQYPQFQGSVSSQSEAIEAFKQTLKEIKKLDTLPVRKTCDDCGLTISGKDFESQDDCPDCLINNR